VVKIPGWLEKLVVLLLLWYRRQRYGYPFRRIRLSQNKYAIVDTDDYERLSKYKWHTASSRGCLYACRCVNMGRKKKEDNKNAPRDY